MATEAFALFSGIPEIDTAFSVAKREMSENIVDGHFQAGSYWSQVWTRDTSFSIELAAGLLYPEVSKASLKNVTEEDKQLGTVWLQDTCGHFGGWPNLTDAIVGSRGAWTHYTLTGDTDFLEWSYSVTVNSLRRAERDAWDSESGLITGCSSFMESNSGYPARYKFNGGLVGRTKALSTNLLYLSGYLQAAAMAGELKRPVDEVKALRERGERLSTAIQTRMWIKERGYYSYFEDEAGRLVDRQEALGEALVLLSPGFNDGERVRSVLSRTFSSDKGLPCLWPMWDIDEDPRDVATYYHNGRIWPFTQGYFMLGAARHGRSDVFGNELDKLLALYMSNQTFAEFYNVNGTHLPERKRQLWSDAGFLSAIFYGIFGLTFVVDGISFHPVKPAGRFPGDVWLYHVSYRAATLDIGVSGTGSVLKEFTLNGRETDPFIGKDVTGHVVVHMKLA